MSTAVSSCGLLSRKASDACTEQALLRPLQPGSHVGIARVSGLHSKISKSVCSLSRQHYDGEGAG